MVRFESTFGFESAFGFLVIAHCLHARDKWLCFVRKDA